MKTAKLFDGVAIKSMTGRMPDEISGVTDNSEEVEKGGLFFCRTGNNYDGSQFVRKAEEMGAAVVVGEGHIDTRVCLVEVADIRPAMAKICSAFYGHPENKLVKIGLVGTNGKTTTCSLIAQCLKSFGVKVGLTGTIGTEICGSRRDSALTTPGTAEMYRLMKETADLGGTVYITEVSAHAIAQKRTEGVRFDVLAFTNCTEDHLDYFGDMKTYSEVKKSAFIKEKCDIAAVNTDDLLGKEIVVGTDCGIISYGIGSSADVFAENVAESADGISFDLVSDGCKTHVENPLIGRFNVYNCLAAAACLRAMKIPSEKIGRALCDARPVDGRLQLAAKFRGASIYVDYAHTPDGLEKSLSALKKICRGRLICVFGCGGNREKEKRPIMGAISAKLADLTVITSDNPRFENALGIIRDVERGAAAAGGEYIAEPDRKSAVMKALLNARKDDLVLIAGKGAEKYMEINGIKYDYNDVDAVSDCIRQLADGEND